MTRHITTSSGAAYEISDDGSLVRRIEGSSANGKRSDGDWVSLFTTLPETSLVGTRMVLELESLNHVGADDYGVPQDSPDASTVTIRITTTVVSDEALS